jgi:hypothetical protein
MAKKPAPKKAPAKKPVAAKKPAAKKPVVVKKAAPQKAPPAKKPVVLKTKPAPAPTAIKKPEPAPVVKPAFEAPVPKPAAPVVSAPAPKLVMKTGAGGATSLTVSAQTSAGAAANGNTHPANILVLVSSGGWPVTELTKDHFTLMEYFEVPGQQAPFSNNITSFRNVGTGAYLLQVKPINGAPWRSGHHLAQILVSSSDDRQGQCAAKLIIR